MYDCRVSAASKFESQLSEYFAKEIETIRKISENCISLLLVYLLQLREQGGRLFIAGNGGSASTAEHFATDIGVGALNRYPGSQISTISLVSNMASVTATGNDLNYRDIFSNQLRLHRPQKGELLIVFSASGQSPNIIEAIKVAKELGIKSCAITGFDGGSARKMCDFSIHVETPIGEYGITEDAHLAICHAISEILRTSLREEK